MGRAARRPLPPPVEVEVENAESEGRGVARVAGKVTFVDMALPGERVLARYTRTRGSFDEAVVESVLRASPQRVTPRCVHVRSCGGCSLQHLTHEAQVVHKQRLLFEALERLGGVTPAAVLAPVLGEPWGYRRRARLAVRHVPAKGGVLVGFRERHGGRVAAIECCEVLHPQVGTLIRPLRVLLGGLQARARIPQIEAAVGEPGAALVFRTLVPLSAADRGALAAFAREHAVQVLLQPGGPDTVTALEPATRAPLRYRLASFDVDLEFEPADFVQVNAQVNAQLVQRVVAALELDGGQRVLDLFCGLGNFSLALARRAAMVNGVEGAVALVERARANARRNGIANAVFETADLSDSAQAARHTAGGHQRLCLDPPRAGAPAVVQALCAPYPTRVAYVSCNPASLARDARVLVHRHGYRLAAAGVADMFPHTSHVEALAVFDRPGA